MFFFTPIGYVIDELNSKKELIELLKMKKGEIPKESYT